MERMVDEGYAKSIGVSNFNETQIQRILDNSRIKPVTNQVELHLYLRQESMVNYCKENNIVVTAYSPLGSKGIAKMMKSAGVTKDVPDLLDNDVVKSIAANHNKTPAQVLLRDIVQRGIIAIPKSTNAGRLQQNIEIFDFELTADEVESLRGQNQDFRVNGFEFFKG